MAIEKYGINPFIAQKPAINELYPPVNPITSPAPFQAGIFGATNPFNKAAFTGLGEGTQNGLSLLRTNPGEMGLGDRAITTLKDDKVVKQGAKLFLSV